ncbi:carboxypeptidase SOL1-like isoform X2 [Salvia hispanica]|uniref:carboxypeptidase SOL1-like isoform X2 n=1 Tax=Salvia hispanica TaxID=49212 RepID=UPI00200941C6|nr:carboxypeptidase SOL1-like isoform X2 [Salvia hispanica]
MIFSLLFLCLNLSSLFRFSSARGAQLRTYNQSGYDDRNYENSGRRMYSMNDFQMTEEDYNARLEKLAKGYMSNSDLQEAMQEFNSRCPNISRVYSIGKSVFGVPLLAMEISDTPGTIDAEPSFKATTIVDDVHLHILPSMNPDGYALRRRGNANNIDLNRDFPDQFFHMNDDMDLRQPETKAMLKWMKDIHFTASATLHGGALVANYPWDGTEDKRRDYFGCPDDKTFRFLASLYSRSHYKMSRSKEFPGGITNGAFWYPLYGGMQDWNYIHSGCFELTLEISDEKWPDASELPKIWDHNRMSMLKIVGSIIKTGIHGQVFSSDGKPLPASIAIQGINYTIAAGKKFGEYYRLLAPGEKYEVIASMPGYRSKRACVILGEAAQTVDFVLDSESSSIYKDGPVLEDSGCYPESKTGLQAADLLPATQLEFCLLLFVMAGFLCFLMKRRARRNEKQISVPRRAAMV